MTKEESRREQVEKLIAMAEELATTRPDLAPDLLAVAKAVREREGLPEPPAPEIPE